MPSAGRRVARQRPRELRVASDTSPHRRATRQRLNVAGLFAGIGGIELGLARAGHHTELLCEIDPSARAVLAARFRGFEDHADIRSLRTLPRSTELLAAGFPCQDLSQAGMTAGIAGARSGLIGEVFRLVRERPVPWLLLENVPFMLQLRGGRALEVIIGALESLGYRWAYRVVDSLSFGLPQRRERVFLVASLDGDPRQVLLSDDEGAPEPTPPSQDLAFGFYWTEGTRGLGAAINAVPTLKGGSTIGIPSPPAVLLPGGGGVVTPRIEDAERLQGFEAGWTEPAVGRRSHRWKLVGNAVTVEVAAWIGERLAVPRPYDGWSDTPLPSGRRWPTAAWNMGKGRFLANVSPWPVRRDRPDLHDFLVDPRPLSVRATEGFLNRLTASSLRYPPWFKKGVKNHLRQMKAAEVPRQKPSPAETECSGDGTQTPDRVDEAVA
jgi:DNA (cytosine-5)-methyltransferase 1